MGQIKKLDQHMINMIAAGEVIERPASVVKELIENSIDSGAERIIVNVQDGGTRYISVTDDGCGMDAEDLAYAFEPHATSKIKNTDDLREIATLGFRGEALASITSVAKVKAVSRTKENNNGNSIEIDCGAGEQVKPCSSDYGTTIEIRDLFYKVPARRKFLKSANTEMKHITECFTRMALCNSSTEMTLLSDGRQVFKLNRNESLRQRIEKIFSRQVSDNLIETESNEKGLNIYALAGSPGISKTNAGYQYIFVNRRFIHDKFISHALREAYRAMIEAGRYPVVFLFLEMPYDDVDVNVHPTKIEVRFRNPNLVHSQVLGCIRERLLGSNLDIPAKISSYPEQGKQPVGNAPQKQYEKRTEVIEAMEDFFKRQRSTDSQRRLGFGSPDYIRRYTEIRNEAARGIEHHEISSHKFMQIHNSFLVAETEEGFVVIDQHALHERIIYNRLKKRITDGTLESQRLLVPESFAVSEGQLEAIKANSALIERLGIELEPFGPRTLAIQSFPAILSKVSCLEFVTDLLDLLCGEETVGLDANQLLDEVLEMAACKAAVKAGQKLNEIEIEQLLAEKETTEDASHCPHSRPTTIRFSIKDLEKQFKRT